MIEAMKQSLEALEDITRLLQGITGGTFLKLDSAITSLRQAIAELESQDDSYCQACDGALCTAKKGCVALSNPPQRTEQEPFAWVHNFIDGGISIGKRPSDLDRHPDRWTALYKEPKPCPTCEALARTVMLDQTSHATHPPQRTWQGLTDEDDIDWEEGGNLKDLVKAIESKLKQKNGFTEEKNT